MNSEKVSVNSRRKGFTLIELLIAMAIIAVLVAVALPSYRRFAFRARQAEATVMLSNMKVNQWGYFGSYDCFANTETMPMGMVGVTRLPWNSMAEGFMDPCDTMERTLRDLGVEPSIEDSYYQYRCSARVSMAVGTTDEFTCAALADFDGDMNLQEVLFCTDQANVGMGLVSPLTGAECFFPYDIFIVSFGTY